MKIKQADKYFCARCTTSNVVGWERRYVNPWSCKKCYLLPEGLHLDGLFVVLPTQLIDLFGGFLQHLLSCLFLMIVKFGLSCLPLCFLQQAAEPLIPEHPVWEIGLASELGIFQPLPQLPESTDLLIQLPLPCSRCLEIQLQVQGGAGHELGQGRPAGLFIAKGSSFQSISHKGGLPGQC